MKRLVLRDARLYYQSSLLTIVFTTLLGIAPIACADGASQTSRQLFSQYQSLIVQVKILNNASGKKSGIGTGFFVKENGYIVTNYHVIADLVFQPDHYSATYVRDDGSSGPLQIVAFDIVHDLALLQADIPNQKFFPLNPALLQKGAQIYALGNPHDLGFVIISGHHGGLIENSLYEKIHFVGTLQPGMSGGPAFTANGEVIGVNVATAGDQVSFLVPAKYVLEMMAQNGDRKTDLLAQVGEQLMNNQQRYMSQLIQHPIKVAALGQYRVPDKLSKVFRCWGGDTLAKAKPYHIIEQSCATKDDIFINDNHSSGAIKFKHYLISSDQLGPFRFYALFESRFARLVMQLEGHQSAVSNFRCQENFVVNNGVHMKVVFCARGYKKFADLYDVVVKAATVDHDNSGLQTALLLTGVSFGYAQQFAKKYLDSITWQP